MNPNNPEQVQAEMDALFEHAAARGLNAQDLSILCALTLGSIAREAAAGEDDKRLGLDSLIDLARHHARVSGGH